MSDNQMNQDNGSWEKDTIKELAKSALIEQRRSRRWGIFFKLLIFAYVGMFLVIGMLAGISSKSDKKDHTALLKLDGVIAAEESINAADVNKLLETVFEKENVKGVVMEINSPGGSPVQSEAIYNKIRALREEYPDKKLYAVATDVCASGGYYIASAADEIYAAKASIVGSVGVRMDSFGVTELMDKIGVESRSMTAGKNKAILSPFKPVNPEHQKHIEKLLSQIHQQFIGDVKAGRGDRLKENDDIFSGLYWNGEEAVELGLVDGLATAEFVAKEVIGEEEMVTYSTEEKLLDKLSKELGKVMAKTMSSFLSEVKVNNMAVY